MKLLQERPFSRRTSGINAEAACGRRRLDPQDQREGVERGRKQLAQHEVFPMQQKYIFLIRPLRHVVSVRTAAGNRRRNRTPACRPKESRRSAQSRVWATQTRPTRLFLRRRLRRQKKRISGYVRIRQVHYEVFVRSENYGGEPTQKRNRPKRSF